LSAPWLLVASVGSPFTVFTNYNPQTSTCIILAPVQAIERKVNIIVSLILDCRGSCGGLVAEDGGGGLFFTVKLLYGFVENVSNSKLFLCGLYKP